MGFKIRVKKTEGLYWCQKEVGTVKSSILLLNWGSTVLWALRIMVKLVLKFLSTWGTSLDHINLGEKPVPNSTVMSALVSQYNKLQNTWANLYNKIPLSSLFEKKRVEFYF